MTNWQPGDKDRRQYPTVEEHLKIDERLRMCEIQISRLVSHLESEKGTIQRYFSSIKEENDKMFLKINSVLEKVTLALNGDGSTSGILSRLILIEEAKKNQQWHWRALWVVILGVIIKAMFDAFKYFVKG